MINTSKVKVLFAHFVVLIVSLLFTYIDEYHAYYISYEDVDLSQINRWIHTCALIFLFLQTAVCPSIPEGARYLLSSTSRIALIEPQYT